METDQSTGESYRMGDASQDILEWTVGDALAESDQRWADRVALRAPGRRGWTFGELWEDACAVAKAIAGRFDPGDRLAVWAANCPEWVLVEMGAALAGVVLVTVNPAYRAAELTHVLRQSRAKGIILQPHHRGRNLHAVLEESRPALPELREVIDLSRWDEFLRGGTEDRPLPVVLPQHIAQIQYTSGTTGFPKGAQLTHRGLVNNSRFFATTNNAGPDDVWLNPMPMFHTAGCGLVTLGALQTGGAQILPAGFDAGQLLGLCESERATLMLSVPTMLIRMLDEQAVAPRDVSSFRLAMLGGAPVPPELVRRAAAELGADVTIGFGQTEASPYITHTLPGDPHPEWTATVGRPLPRTEVRIAHPDTGATVPIGVVGEICTRGVGVMASYFDDPAATAAALDDDNWLHTGDLGRMDEHGYVSIQGRLKDMIIRGGENIYPREIEDLLFTHPDVADVAVVGVPDAEMGEQVVAFVRPAAGSTPSPEALREFCREHLAAYKTPRAWRFVDDFPQTASGKIQKFALRERFVSGQA